MHGLVIDESILKILWQAFKDSKIFQNNPIYCGIFDTLCCNDGTSNSYTMGCPPVRGDNPRALASGLSYVQVDKRGITILYHLH